MPSRSDGTSDDNGSKMVAYHGTRYHMVDMEREFENLIMYSCIVVP